MAATLLVSSRMVAAIVNDLSYMHLAQPAGVVVSGWSTREQAVP